MKKRIIATLMVAVLAASMLGGCGVKKSNDKKDEIDESTKNELQSELEQYNSEEDKKASEKDEILDKLTSYKPAKEWKDKEYAGRGFQIADVFIYEGEKMSDVIASFEDSDIEWQYTYNPDGEVDYHNVFSFKCNNMDMCSIDAYADNTDKKCKSSDSIVYYIDGGVNSDGCIYYNGINNSEIYKYTMDDLKNLKNTLFKNIDDVESEATAEGYIYKVKYQVTTPNGNRLFDKTYNFRIIDGRCIQTGSRSVEDM